MWKNKLPQENKCMKTNDFSNAIEMELYHAKMKLDSRKKRNNTFL